MALSQKVAKQVSKTVVVQSLTPVLEELTKLVWLKLIHSAKILGRQVSAPKLAKSDQSLPHIGISIPVYQRLILPTTPPEPWLSFLTELDRIAGEPTVLSCFGGFALTQQYGLRRGTQDIDVCEVVPIEARARLLEAGMRGRVPSQTYVSTKNAKRFPPRGIRRGCRRARGREHDESGGLCGSSNFCHAFCSFTAGAASVSVVRASVWSKGTCGCMVAP